MSRITYVIYTKRQRSIIKDVPNNKFVIHVINKKLMTMYYKKIICISLKNHIIKILYKV